MKRYADKPIENKSRAAANNLPLQQNSSDRTRQLQAIQQQFTNLLIPATRDPKEVIQRFKINQYDDYNGYLAGEGAIRSTQRVKDMIDILSAGGQISNAEPIKACMGVKMVKETDTSNPWQYIARDEYEGEDEPKIFKRNVLTDGHHRFVAHVETGVPMPKIVAAEEGEGQFGYIWKTMGGMDEVYEPKSQKAKPEAGKTPMPGKAPGKAPEKPPAKTEASKDAPYSKKDFELDSGEIGYAQWQPIALFAMKKIKVTRELDMSLPDLLKMAYDHGYTPNMFASMMENGTW
jgi:hypothetical protein